MISFCKMTPDHLPLFLSWLNEPHVKPFWQEDGDLQKVSEKFFGRMPQMGIKSFIVEVRGKPVGYIQSYEAAKMGSGWWEGYERGVFGMDLLIGDQGTAGIGLGSAILKKYIWEHLSGSEVKSLIIDPEPSNLKAIRCYEKIGFKRKDLIRTPNGDAVLMTFIRPNEDCMALLEKYERNINRHDFSTVRDFISESGLFWFNDGQYSGLQQIENVFNKTWTNIKDEFYWLTDENWLAISDTVATCTYTFNWRGIIDGQEHGGKGRGTSVLRKENGYWKIVHEHLSRFPK